MDYSTSTPRRTCSCPPGAHSLLLRAKFLVREGKDAVRDVDALAAKAVGNGFTSWGAMETALENDASGLTGLHGAALSRALLK
jgi:hypothetical protein